MNQSKKPQPIQLDPEALERADQVLRRMLEAPPKPHDAMTSAPKKRAKKPQK